MRTALVGYTGFVGGSLLRQFPTDDCFNSENIESLKGRSYDLLLCAGAPGVKWKANKEPEQDRASIDRLMVALALANAREVILISTVDVYPSPVAVDEDTWLDEHGGSPYGRHRLLLERFVQERFPTTVVRLPGLFGDGLKKNVIYDLLHDNALDGVCPESVYQFYPLDRLWSDIVRVRRQQIPLVNFATEGVSVTELARRAFDVDFVNPREIAAARYDFRTKYADCLDGSGGYLYNKGQVLAAMAAFVERHRASKTGVGTR